MPDTRPEVYEPGRWWRVLRPDGLLWAETSDEQEAREAMRPGYTLEREYVLTVREWREVEETS